jgi:hypothetical protein
LQRCSLGQNRLKRARQATGSEGSGGLLHRTVIVVPGGERPQTRAGGAGDEPFRGFVDEQMEECVVGR